MATLPSRGRLMFVHGRWRVVGLLVIIAGVALGVSLLFHLQSCNLHLSRVEGSVSSYTGSGGISGLAVFEACPDGTVLGAATTDSSGHFSFHSNSSMPNQTYMVTVNGNPSQMGITVLSPQWGQWEGVVTTDLNGHSLADIILEPSAVISVPLAALFTNSSNVIMHFGYSTADFFTLTFAVNNASIVTGYNSSISLHEQGPGIANTGFSLNRPGGGILVKPYYASTFFCDSGTVCTERFGGIGIRAAGVTDQVPHWGWGTNETEEYLDLNTIISNPLEYKQGNVEVGPGGTMSAKYNMSGSVTWSPNNNVPYALRFIAYGKTISLNLTVSAITGVWNIPLPPPYLGIGFETKSVNYTACYTTYPDVDPSKGTVPELHVWERACEPNQLKSSVRSSAGDSPHEIIVERNRTARAEQSISCLISPRQFKPCNLKNWFIGLPSQGEALSTKSSAP